MLSKARSICETRLLQTCGLLNEVDVVAKMLDELTFSTPIANKKRLPVIKAMGGPLDDLRWHSCPNERPSPMKKCRHDGADRVPGMWRTRGRAAR